MARTDRRSTRDLIEEIRRDGPRFGFFQAVRLLSLSATKKAAGLPAKLRFGTPASLAFPPSEILDVQTRRDLAPAANSNAVEVSVTQADHDALQLTVGFMGLTGPSGVLPAAYTELLMERRHVFRDTAAHQFFDMFSHRATSLFYEAWRKHRFYLAYEAGDRDGFTRNLLDVVGVGLNSTRNRLKHDASGIPDVFLAHFAGLLARKPVSTTSLAAVLRGYFGVHAEIEQFVGQWIAIPKDEQSRLGAQACVLDESAFAGERMWDRQTKIRIHLGPLNSAEFAEFLPGAPGAIALMELVQFGIGQTLACDVALTLDKACIPAPQLAMSGPTDLRLGYNSWLHTRPPEEHGKDACFALLQ